MTGNQQYLLGIDIGTSACKVNAFCLDGTIRATASCSYRVYYPHSGWAEQDADEWWEAACRAVRDCMEQLGGGEILAVGVDGQSWSCIPLSAQGEVLARTPIWTDTRANAVCERLRQEDANNRIYTTSGNLLQPTYTTGKLLWFQKECPQIYRHTAWFLQSNSFIVYRLTGAISQDESQSYGIHAYDTKTGRLDTELCRQLGIDQEKLPPVVPCHAIVGRVTVQAALATGLLAGTPVVAGGLDAACGALGVGVCKPGMTQEQGGQAGGMSICVDHPVLEKKLILGRHVVPGQWLLQGGTVAGSGSLQWAAAAIGQQEAEDGAAKGISQMQRIDELAAEAAPGSGGLIFLPYLLGERSPIWDANACGMFFGLQYSTRKAELYRSVMEGTAYALRHNLETAAEAGAKVETLRAMGGASKSRFWMQLKADVTGKRVRTFSSGGYASTLGAAILAGVGTGVWPDFAAACDAVIHPAEAYEPNEKNRAVYDSGYDIYRKLYPATKQLMIERQKLTPFED